VQHSSVQPLRVSEIAAAGPAGAVPPSHDFDLGSSTADVLVRPVRHCVGHADIAPSRLSGASDSLTWDDVPRVFHGLPLIGDPEIDRLQTEG
jgi:hypothetical protein